MNTIKIMFITISVAIILLAALLNAHYIAVHDVNLEKVFEILAALFLIALFMERALDVFLTTWRAPRSEEMAGEIRELQNKYKVTSEQAELKGKDKSSKLDQLDQQRKNLSNELRQFKSQTRTIAMWSSLVMGLLVSAIGFRMLQGLIDPILFKEAPGFQKAMFRIVDIFLTGGVLAGGSDWIHKLMELFRTFTETTTQKTSGI